MIDEDHTGALTGSGWTTDYVESADDCDHARRLLGLSSLYHANVPKKTPTDTGEFADVDVEAEPDGTGPSDPVRAAFERR